MINLSIITINYNNADGLLATIKSVANQSRKEFEFIIIDGGSTDKSLKIIKENNQHITYWCSEKDKGIYHAQNKGIANATGKYVLFLNSGDTFYVDFVIEKFYNFPKPENNLIIYGNTNLINIDNTQYIKVQPKQLSLNFWYKETVNHQSAFISKNLFSQYGVYNTDYKICSDFDFFLKVYINNPKAFLYMDLVIANYTLDGLSSTPANFILFLKERDIILNKQLTKGQFNQLKKSYIKTLPIKEQLLQFIYRYSVFKNLFKIAHKTYTFIKR